MHMDYEYFRYYRGQFKNLCPAKTGAMYTPSRSQRLKNKKRKK